MNNSSNKNPVIVSNNLDSDSERKLSAKYDSVISADKNKVEDNDVSVKSDSFDPEKLGFDNYVISEATPTYIRHQFARKVFLIVSIELLFSFGFMLTCYLIEKSREFFKSAPYVGIAAGVVFLILIIALAIRPNIARNKTGGIFSSVLVTVCLTLVITTIASYYKLPVLLGAMGTTAAVTVGLGLIAIQTKYDFTKWIGYLFVVCCVLLCFGIMSIFMKSRILALILSGVGTLLACFYIIVDVQLIMGGKRKYQFSIDDHFFASIILYSDIISLFIRLISFIGGFK